MAPTHQRDKEKMRFARELKKSAMSSTNASGGCLESTNTLERYANWTKIPGETLLRTVCDDVKQLNEQFITQNKQFITQNKQLQQLRAFKEKVKTTLETYESTGNQPTSTLQIQGSNENVVEGMAVIRTLLLQLEGNLEGEEVNKRENKQTNIDHDPIPSPLPPPAAESPVMPPEESAPTEPSQPKYFDIFRMSKKSSPPVNEPTTQTTPESTTVTTNTRTKQLSDNKVIKAFQETMKLESQGSVIYLFWC